MKNLGNANEFIQGVYTDLDALFDTRFAVLEQLDKKLALENLKAGWSTREDDEFLGIDRATFRQLFDSRDISVLQLAQPTPILQSIKQWVFKALKHIAGSPNGDQVVVFVNTHPYLLKKEEALKIGAEIQQTLGDTVEVRMLNVKPEEIDTETAAKYFSAMFMYDWDSWLEANTKNGSFNRKKIPDVTLYAPKVFKEGSPNEQMKLLQSKQKMTIFDEFEMTAGPQIGIEFIEIAFFANQFPENYLDFYDKAVARFGEKQ